MMKNANLLKICLLLISACLSSCMETVTGEGPLQTVERKMESFNSIALNLGAEVTVVRADENLLVVSAQENIIERVITRIDGNTLVITAKGNLIPQKPVQIEVRMKEMMNFEINGSGEMIFEEPVVADYIDFSVTGSGSVKADLDVRKVTSVVTGSGTIKLTGKTGDLDGEVLGSGTIQAGSLTAEQARFKLSGSGEVFTHATELLEATVNGSGEIRYSGQPEVKKTIAGSGKVIPE